MVRLTIDGRPVTAVVGTTIWELAQREGIEIPALCHSPRLPPAGVCRMCVVDVGGRVLAASCVRTCEEGMTVRTTGSDLDRHRKTLTALLLREHPSPCRREETTADCQLEALGRRHGLLAEKTSHRPRPRHRPVDLSSPVIAVDHQACILCDRCIRACNDIQHNEVLGRSGRGEQGRIAFDLDQPMGASTCVSCGECVASCPTGALTNKALSLPLVAKDQTRPIDSVCPYCGVGCAITYHVHDRHILWAEGRDGGGNAGRLCVKGRYGWDYATHVQRLANPLIRRTEGYPKGPLSPEVAGEHHPGSRGRVDHSLLLAGFREAGWDEALDLVAERLSAIKARYGPGSLAGFGSAKCSNEEAYLFQKLFRAVLGTNHVDHCTRLCHASSVAALLEGIGSGAVTDIYRHALLADVLLLTGTNTTSNHPVAATYFKEAARRGAKLIVVDPRRPDIADHATWYCRLNPGTDVAFYNALMHVMIQERLVDEAFIRDRTDGFQALRTLVAQYPPERSAPVCGVDASTIRAIARTIGRSRQMMIFWGMGISQHTHGTDNARCLIALSLLTGNVGRPGTGLHPLRGQNNVQGASDAGLIPMFYPDYQSVADEGTRRKFERAWGVELSPTPGLTVVEIMAAALEGRIRGMFMMGENPFLSDPNVNKVRKALSQLEFLAVQDIFLTETAEFADVVLPASSCLEKLGTYTNTDRQVQIGRPVLDLPGQARLDWQVLCDLSNRLGYPMKYSGVEEVFEEFASLTSGYAGLTYEALGTNGKIWPCPTPETSDGTEVLFSERFPTANGRGRFIPCEFLPARELPDAEFPLVLNTGRLLEHWHTGTMSRRAHALDALQPGPFLEVHPEDLAALGILDAEIVTVISRRGSIQLPVRASRAVMPGSLFLPFHFREAAANVLTIDELDPRGKIPEFKFCAVRVERIRERA